MTLLNSSLNISWYAVFVFELYKNWSIRIDSVTARLRSYVADGEAQPEKESNLCMFVCSSWNHIECGHADAISRMSTLNLGAMHVNYEGLVEAPTVQHFVHNLHPGICNA